MEKSIFSKEHRWLLSVLREVRHEAGLTQVQLGKRLRKPQSFVSKYEIGERRLDLVELRQVCGAVGIALGELVRRFEQQGRGGR